MRRVSVKSIFMARGDVHVWRVSLLCAPDEIACLLPILTPEEVVRAERYRFERDRSAFVVRRGVLRLLVGRYLGQGPFRQPFSVTAYGQPLMPAGILGEDLRFSVSHSGGVALLAFARGREIGVDVEAVRSDVDYCGIAQRFFSKREQETLRSLPAEQQREAFFACWSRKEAYIKARGKGLSIPLDQFDVSLRPGEPAQLLATRDNSDSTEIWSMAALDPGPRLAAALVVEGQDVHITCWDWPESQPLPRTTTVCWV